MRIALVFSLLISILAVVFALSNTQQVSVAFGPSLQSIPLPLSLLLIVTLLIGALIGILAATPSVLRARKRVKVLERERTDRPVPSASLPSSGSASAEPDPYTARFGTPPHKI